jgi:hypothetical protein
MTRSPKKTIRIVHGLRLVSTYPGFWALEANPRVMFQRMLGKARLGTSGARYSVERWLYPDGRDGGTAMSLEAAVKRYLAVGRTETKQPGED